MKTYGAVITGKNEDGTAYKDGVRVRAKNSADAANRIKIYKHPEEKILGGYVGPVEETDTGSS